MSFKHYGFFHLRSPLLPLKMLDKFYSSDASSVVDEALRDAKLRALLWSTAPRLMRARESKNQKREIDLKLIAYLIRAASRCTPTGLAAGVSVGTIGNGANFDGGPLQDRVVTDLDTTFQRKMLEGPSRDLPAVIGLNVTYAGAGELVSVTGSDGQPCLYKLKPKARQFLDGLRVAATWSTDETIASLKKKFRVDAGDAREFIVQMLRLGLLLGADVSSLITSKPGTRASLLPARERSKALAPIAKIHDVALADVTENLVAASQTFLEGDLSHPLHFELLRDHAPVTLPQRWVDQVGKAVELLHFMFYDDRSTAPAALWMKRIASEIQRTHESAPIPLNRLFGAFGIADVPFNDDLERRDKATTMAARLLARPGLEVRVGGDELDWLKTRASSEAHKSWSQAKSASALLQIVRCEGRDRIWLKGLMGGSSISHLGRFAYFDANLRKNLDQIAKKETELYGACVDLACVFSAEGENVNRRPRTFENVLGLTNLMADPKINSLAPDDLFVLAAGDRLELHSKSLGRVVRPVSTSATDFLLGKNNLLRLLMMIGNANWLPTLYWGWGGVGARYYPRVRYGDVILSPAQWRLEKDPFLSALKSAENFRDYRARENLPKWVCLPEFDRYLPVNLESTTGRQLVEQWAKRAEEWVHLIEHFESSPLTFNGDSFAAEMTVPLYQEGPSHFGRKINKDFIDMESPERVFPPGSKWAYFQLFVTPTLQDQLLLAIDSCFREGKKKWNFKKWFFIRFDEPSAHLRLRVELHGNSEARARALRWLNEKLSGLCRTKLATNFQQMTYRREIETYGGLRGTMLYEDLSAEITAWSCDFLKHPKPPSAPLLVWPSSQHVELLVQQMASLGCALGVSHQEMAAWLEAVGRAKPRARIKLADKDRKTIDQAFREMHRQWPAIIVRAENDEKTKRLASIAKKYREHRVPRLLNRFLHMNVNRLSINIDGIEEARFAKWLARSYREIALAKK